MSTEMIDDEEYTKALIVRALRKSFVKRRIMEYLGKCGYSYLSEIARHIDVTPTNVCGAIRGMRNRYSKEDSLLSLKVITEIASRGEGNKKIYCLTSLGKQSLKMWRRVERVEMTYD